MTSQPADLPTRPVPGAPPVTPPARRPTPTSEVIDLEAARSVRRPVVQSSTVQGTIRGNTLPDGGWSCPECALTAGPYPPAEAVMLAAVHDLVMRHPPHTAALLSTARQPLLGGTHRPGTR